MAILFEWKRLHEHKTIERLERASDELRLKIIERELTEFKPGSYLAQQIVIDKPADWEYKLTAELLRSQLDPVLSRWRDLEAGLYTKRLTIISAQDATQWLSARFEELERLMVAFRGLVTSELQTSSGPPGCHGNAHDILRRAL